MSNNKERGPKCVYLTLPEPIYLASKVFLSQDKDTLGNPTRSRNGICRARADGDLSWWMSLSAPLIEYRASSVCRPKKNIIPVAGLPVDGPDYRGFPSWTNTCCVSALRVQMQGAISAKRMTQGEAESQAQECGAGGLVHPITCLSLSRRVFASFCIQESAPELDQLRFPTLHHGLHQVCRGI